MKGLCCKTNQLTTSEVMNFTGDDYINVGCSMRGAWRSLQCMGDDVAIIVHGPEGCNNEFKLDYTNGLANTYCTKLTDENIIIGGIEKLENLVIQIDQQKKSKLIVILGTCASELIGEDIDGVISYLKDKVNARLISLHTSGVSGMMQSEGHNMVISELAKNIMEKQETIPNSINYIGYAWPWDSRAGRDLSELKKLLEKVGITLNTVLTAGATVKDIVRAPAAALNVIRCPGSAYDTISFMKDEFDIPYLNLPIPVGIDNTTIFFTKLLNFFGLKDKLSFILEEERKIKAKIEKVLPYLKGKKVAVSIGANRTLHFVKALVELGLEIKVISFYRLHESIGDSVTKISGKTFEKLDKIVRKFNIDATVLAYSDLKQFENVLKQENVDLVFDVHTHRKFIHYLGLGFAESMDSPQPYRFYNGALALAYDLVKELNQPFYKKYRKYCAL